MGTTSSGPDGETLYRGAAAIAFVIGIGALLAPKQLVRLYGMDPEEMNGTSAFGWRLFAARNILIGGAALRGSQVARDTTLALQAPDQLIFLHAFRTRSIPRPTAVLAMITSGAVAAMCAIARSRG